MSSTSVQLVKDGKLYEVRKPYNSDVVYKYIINNVHYASKTINGVYYYVTINGELHSNLSIISSGYDLPIRVDNIGKPVLVYSNKLIVIMGDYVMQINMENASSHNLIGLIGNKIYSHNNHTLTVIATESDEYKIDHFIMDDKTFYMGKIVEDKYEFTVGDDDFTAKIDLPPKCKLFGSKYFVNDTNQVYVFNYMKLEIEYLFNLWDGQLREVNGQLQILRGGKLYVETTSYNSIIMVELF